jgi:diguanylate cyclase (GGDEF)-like protein
VIGALLCGQDITELAETTAELARYRRHTEATAAAVRAVLTRTGGPAAIVDAAQKITAAALVALFQPDGLGNLVCTSSTNDAVLGLAVPLSKPSATTTCFTTQTPIWVDALPDPRLDTATVDTISAMLGLPLQTGAWYPITTGSSSSRSLAVLVVAAAAGTPPPSGNHTMLDHLATEAALALAHEQAVTELEHLSGRDPLTGAGNRRAWEMALAREMPKALREQRPLSLLMIDLDHFKAYNDTFGHGGGDDLLRRAVHAWTNRLRPSDLLCRWGGEEFAVLLPGTDATQALAVAEDLRALMPPGTSCSIGAAQWNRYESHHDFIARADAYLYTAKANGRDRVENSTTRRPTA